MIESTLAVGDLITGIPNLYNSLKVPLGIVALVVGGVAGALALHKGFGTAVGKVLGGIVIAVLIFGGLGIAMSLKTTVDRHGGSITTGQYGQ